MLEPQAASQVDCVIALKPQIVTGDPPMGGVPAKPAPGGAGRSLPEYWVAWGCRIADNPGRQ